jgi:hypothetical protein
VKRYARSRGKAPLVVAALIATPLYFLSLMAVTLATEHAEIVAQWRTGQTRKLITIYAQPSGWGEAKLWLWALVPTAILLLVGLVATRIPFGVVVSSLAGIAGILLIKSRVDTWAEHHADRFPYGVDLIPDANPSSTLIVAEWEATTVGAIDSMSRWLIGLAIGAIVVFVLVEWRRRHGRRDAPQPLPPEVATGEPEIVPTPPSPLER